MTQPLKRTFHGCLTCRRRKVRCLGGNPCPNCSRMNIACHSSFDTNLRIRVSTPTGQKDLETKSSTEKPDATGIQQTAPTPSAQRIFDNSCTDVTTTDFPVQGSYAVATDTGLLGTQMPITDPAYGQETHNWHSVQPHETWDFGGTFPPANSSVQSPHYLETGFQATWPSVDYSMHLDPFASGAPGFQGLGHIFSSEAALLGWSKLARND